MRKLSAYTQIKPCKMTTPLFDIRDRAIYFLAYFVSNTRHIRVYNGKAVFFQSVNSIVTVGIVF